MSFIFRPAEGTWTRESSRSAKGLTQSFFPGVLGLRRARRRRAVRPLHVGEHHHPSDEDEEAEEREDRREADAGRSRLGSSACHGGQLWTRRAAYPPSTGPPSSRERGIECTSSSRCQPACSARNARTSWWFSSGSRLQVEWMSAPPGRTWAAASRRRRPWRAVSSAMAPGPWRPGPRPLGEHPGVAAGGVDEDDVEASVVAQRADAVHGDGLRRSVAEPLEGSEDAREAARADVRADERAGSAIGQRGGLPARRRAQIEHVESGEIARQGSGPRGVFTLHGQAPLEEGRAPQNRPRAVRRSDEDVGGAAFAGDDLETGELVAHGVPRAGQGVRAGTAAPPPASRASAFAPSAPYRFVHRLCRAEGIDSASSAQRWGCWEGRGRPARRSAGRGPRGRRSGRPSGPRRSAR